VLSNALFLDLKLPEYVFRPIPAHTVGKLHRSPNLLAGFIR